MGEWSLPAVHDVIAAAIPDREMLVGPTVRRTFAEVAERSRGLAASFAGRGLGVRRERAQLKRWECGQATVALVLHNCPEYVEAMLGCYRARAVPINVNQHYRPAEVHSLLDMVRAEAVIYHRRLGPLVEAAVGDTIGVLVDVDDGSGVAPLAGSIPYDEAVATPVPAGGLPVPSPDDLYIVCTGGTTGTPKGVLWRQADMFVSGMGGTEATTAESLAADVRAETGIWFAAPPLMHGAAQWTAFAGLHRGATIVLHDDSAPFDAGTILETAARERVTFLTIVGDAYARPLIDELEQRSYDLDALAVLATGGASTSAAAKEALLELLPHVMIVEGYGASETGGMAYGTSVRGARSDTFAPSEGAAVLSADRSRVLDPGDEEIGWIVRRGRVPLGYLDNREKTEETFPIVDGERLSVPGDRGRALADGQIEMLGRDSLVVNTGGEKVFVEEVEETLRAHPDVADALVVGRPSERFGQEVVAVVQLRSGARVEPRELREFAAKSLARFKAPRAVAFCEQIGRHASGKADYRWARTVAADAVAATSPNAG